MSDTKEENLTRALSAYAAGAAEPPAGLVDIVEHRYRRRRRGRLLASSVAGVAAVAVVLVSATVVVGGQHGGSAAAVPAAPRSSGEVSTAPAKASPLPSPYQAGGPWHFPASLQNAPSPSQVWPDALVHVPAKTSDGVKLRLTGRIDATHLLMTGQPKFEASGQLYSVDTTTGVATLIVPRMSDTTKSAYINHLAISPHWVVWIIPTGHGIRFFKAPLSGGDPQLVASLPTTPEDMGPLFATDDAIYWSKGSGGVIRLPMSGGTPASLSGFENFVVTDDSPWVASVTYSVKGAATSSNGLGLGYAIVHGLKNVVTGAAINVAAPVGTINMTCTPDYCVGETGTVTGTVNSLRIDISQSFIQRPDGTGREVLPKSFVGDMRDGILIERPEGTKSLAFDPRSGKFAEWDDHGSFFDSANLLAWTSGSVSFGTVLVLQNIT